MGISLGSVRAGAKVLAQNVPVTGALGVNLLLTDPLDFNAAVTQALQLFSRDRANERVVDVALSAAGFRIGLKGSGAAAELTGADAWARQSQLRGAWLPFDSTSQAQDPMDPNDYRVVDDPNGAMALELLAATFSSGDVVRLKFTRPHTLTEAPNAVANPTAAPTVDLVAPAAAGNVENGSHGYVFTYITAHGETAPSAVASVTVVDKTANGQVAVVVPDSADFGVTGAKIYRTVAGGAGSKKLAGSITETNGGGTFIDNVADAGLGAVAPSTNTAGGGNSVDDDDEPVLTMLAASLILQLAANKSAQNTGNTNLPSDIVDRRTQSDIYRSRSKELREHYNTLVGHGSADDIGAHSAFGELDVEFSGGGPWLFHQNR